MNRLEGRTALVTGGSRGIGRAIVERLAREGAAVSFGYAADRAAAEQVLAACAELPGEVRAHQADLGEVAAARALYAAAEQDFGPLDVLVNNAAMPSGGAGFADATEERYDRVMAVNAKAVFFLIQEAARRMRDGGRIVNVSTINTVMPTQRIGLYAASKGAVEQFTAIAATELAPRGITVNTVSPGFTDTDLLRGSSGPEALPGLAAQTPLGRLGEPADIAATVAFLVSDDGAWLTGQNIRPSGGVR